MSYIKPDNKPAVNPNKVEILAILDRSGSMSAVLNDAIGGFNKFLADQQALPGEASMTMVLFDTEYLSPVIDTELHRVNPLNEQTFVPRGMTALHDAMGRGLTELLARSPAKAIIVVLTDGEENASKEFDAAQVKRLSEQCKEKGYEIVYLAANQDAIKVGAKLGVTRAFNYKDDGAGTQSAYNTLSAATTNYRTNGGALPPPSK